jgi:zinc/manganese transport system substrate-binding protein
MLDFGRVKLRRTAALVLAIALVAAGCGEDAANDDITIVVTTNILGDVVRNVAGDAATVEVLMAFGVDPHDFQASSAQVARLVSADLVVANGLDLEEGLLDVLEAAEEDGVRVLYVAPALDPIEYGADAGHGHADESDDDHEHDHDDDHADEGDDDHDHDLDPHVWMDPLRMARAAGIIADALTAVAPDGSWTERAVAYASELREADSEIAAMLETVPEERRTLLANHDSFGYFADRYGWRLLPTVIPGGTGSPSSARLAQLVALMRSEGLPAIFVEATKPDDIARAVAAEVGDVAVVRLHTGSLTAEDGEAPTLTDLLMFNARNIAEALTG